MGIHFDHVGIPAVSGKLHNASVTVWVPHTLCHSIILLKMGIKMPGGLKFHRENDKMHLFKVIYRFTR